VGDRGRRAGRAGARQRAVCGARGCLTGTTTNLTKPGGGRTPESRERETGGRSRVRTAAAATGGCGRGTTARGTCRRGGRIVVAGDPLRRESGTRRGLRRRSAPRRVSAGRRGPRRRARAAGRRDGEAPALPHP